MLNSTSPGQLELSNNARVRNHPINRAGFWIVLNLCLFIATSFIAWHILRAQDFNYPLWYEVLAIDDTIKTYGVINRYRRHFEHTPKAEHVRLFSEIVSAIHGNAQGLQTLQYHSAQGDPINTLLTPSEVTHLVDVEHLLQQYTRISWGAIILCLVGIALALKRHTPIPSLRTFWLAWSLLIGGIGLAVALLGPTNVFFQLHRFVFPAGHQWWFGYDESLMTILMKAPLLFGAIGSVWLLLTLVCMTGLLIALQSIAASRNNG